MENYKSSLVLQSLLFEKIKFERKGIKNDNELKISFKVQVGRRGNDNNDLYGVTLSLSGEKQDEYVVDISLLGVFKINDTDELNEKMRLDLINKNAVAILMPYMRSELTLLTAQPGTESVVLPPFNVNNMISKQREE
jgi:preprotein translocase subunit SecB